MFQSIFLFLISLNIFRFQHLKLHYSDSNAPSYTHISFFRMLNQNESLSEKFVRKGFWIYVFVFLTWPLSYGIRMILTHDLSVWDVGLFYGIMSFMVLISTYNDFGMTESLNYFLPKFIVAWDYQRSKTLLLLAFIVQIASSTIVWATIFFLAPWLAEHYFHNVNSLDAIRIMCLFFVGSNLMHIGTTLFSVSQNTKLWRGADFLRMFLTFIGVTVLFLFWSGSLEHYIWAWILGLFLGALVAWIFSYTLYYRVYFQNISLIYDRELSRKFIQYSLATVLTANIGMILWQIDMQIIIFFLWEVSAWYYSWYLALIGIPFVFLSPLIAFLFPVISELTGRGDTEGIRKIWAAFAKYLTIMAIWLSVFFLFFGIPFSIMFFWAGYENSWDILKYSAPFLFFNFLIQLNFQILAGVGRIRERAKILGVTLIFNVILNLIFILWFHWWPQGSALAVWLSWIPMWYMSAHSVREFTHTIDWKTILYNFCASIITLSGVQYVLSYFQISLTPLGIRYESIIIILIAVFASLSIFWLVNRALIDEAKNVLKSVRKTSKA